MFFSRLNSKVSPDTQRPFTIVPWTGEGSGYMVEEGYCFSTFSYGTGSMIPINNLNSRFDFKENEKFYIDFTILPNLQVEKAEIKCTTIGEPPENKNKPEKWVSYPDMFYIQPADEVDEKTGIIKTVSEGKKQIKCYVLIGYREDDTQKNGVINNSPEPPIENSKSRNPVQILFNDIILLASMVSGVPVLFPVPYFDITPHMKSVRGVNL